MTSKENMEKIKQLEAQMEGLVLRVKQAEEEWKKAVEDMNRDKRKREELEKRLQEQETATQGNTRDRAGIGDNRFSFPNGPNKYSKRPKFPTSPAKVANWEQRMTLFLESQGLGYTIRHSTNPVPIVNNCDRANLAYRYGDTGGSCLLYTSPSPRDLSTSRMPSSA